jgi:hypothetical protein
MLGLLVVESCRKLKLPVRDYLATILPGLADLPIQVPEAVRPDALKPQKSSWRCLPFIWWGDGLVALPTLGGPNGVANQINNSGLVVGAAENSLPDYSCSTSKAR